MFRPTKLEFQDISDKICCSSQAIDQLAATANQAELRDLHLLFMEVKRTMIGAHLPHFLLGQVEANERYPRKPSCKLQNLS
jgi:hypothetical protein